MTKVEFIKEVSVKTGYARKDIDEVLGAIGEVVKETLTKDHNEKVTIPGIGSFKAKEVPARDGVSKLGGVDKPWHTDAYTTLTFKVSKEAKVLG